MASPGPRDRESTPSGDRRGGRGDRERDTRRDYNRDSRGGGRDYNRGGSGGGRGGRRGISRNTYAHIHVCRLTPY